MRETRLYGSQGGGAGRSPYPYQNTERNGTKEIAPSISADLQDDAYARMVFSFRVLSCISRGPPIPRIGNRIGLGVRHGDS
jgi:hypothetical protein